MNRIRLLYLFEVFYADLTESICPRFFTILFINIIFWFTVSSKGTGIV